MELVKNQLSVIGGYNLLVAVVRDGRGLWLAVLDVIILLLVGEPGVVAAAVQGEEAGSCSVSL